jgi:hypothetical protein
MRVSRQPPPTTSAIFPSPDRIGAWDRPAAEVLMRATTVSPSERTRHRYSGGTVFSPASSHARSHCRRTRSCRRSCAAESATVRPVRRVRHTNHATHPPPHNAGVALMATAPDPDSNQIVTKVVRKAAINGCVFTAITNARNRPNVVRNSSARDRVRTVDRPRLRRLLRPP